MNSGMAAGLIGPEETDPKAALVTFSKSAINTFRCCTLYLLSFIRVFMLKLLKVQLI